MTRRSGHALAVLVVAVVVACTDAPRAAPPPASPTTASSTATAQPSTAPPGGGTLRFALGSDPAAIDPRFADDDAGAYVVDALFDPLVTLSDDYDRVLPAAARAWEVSDDGLRYAFSLREDATFHDGSTVTAESFVRAFRRIADPNADPPSFLAHKLSPVAGFAATRASGAPLAGVRAPDPFTLEIELSHRFEDLLPRLADPSLAPVPEAADVDPAGFAEQPIGNGPFAMAAEWQHNQFIRVVRFDDHPAPPRLDEVVFQIYADDASGEQQYEDFQRGQVDTAEVPAGSLAAARARFGRSPDGYRGPGVLDGITGTVYHYGFNPTAPPFDDPAVRAAFSQLIDRDRIVDEITLGAREPARSLVPPPLPGAAVGSCGHCRYDPDAARAVLVDDDGGVLPGLESLRILHNRGTTNARVAERIATDVEAALGVAVDVVAADLAPFLERVRAGDVTVFRSGWQADYASAASVLLPLFDRGDPAIGDQAGVAPAGVDELLDTAVAEPDRDRRLALYGEAERLALDQAAVAPIFFYRHTRVVADAALGFRIGPLGEIAWTRIRLDRDPS